MSEFKHVDKSAMLHLLEHAGDAGKDLIKSLLQLYESNTPGILSKMKEDIDSSSMGDLCQQAHSLKSSSMSLGAFKMAEVSASIENVLMKKQNREIEFFQEKLNELNQLFPITIEELEQVAKNMV
ncbi:MAG: hypothetical protein CL676_13970 [Bdellovibrionaceae bacterium]|nr:hypothetical protein [Pseudobdellovibrionaceae bacterium]|tara:strand:+ start:4224 stop:4598 length:375 start_codon:yes stop_codon:yes gene_type:complete